MNESPNRRCNPQRSASDGHAAECGGASDDPEHRVADLYGQPLHPYTRGLLGSLPRIDDEERRELSSIEGMPPVLRAKPAYCPFVQRCGHAVEQCRQANPTLVEITPGHRVACWVDLNTGRARS